MMNEDRAVSNSNSGYTVRHLIPENIIQAKEAMFTQLRLLQDVKHESTRDRVSQRGFFLGTTDTNSTFKQVSKN